ncbi:hypothetical protein [Mesomycoplasma neurolyticum]|uniref:Uncharacterized protein n=1 Tax=Mesomycoplasma neurolyticum TaxID=2120 RepID=A0A449A491_9BACT|nr:hypothetical protein [Mesomycoplasma neurolyticum]VEU59071.1 Uncharacterised protein [Mesomycoplasma neurolyticum]
MLSREANDLDLLFYSEIKDIYTVTKYWEDFKQELNVLEIIYETLVYKKIKIKK